MENLSSEIEASLDGAGATPGSPYGLGTPALQRIERVLDGVFTALAHSFPSPATLPELQFELTIGPSSIHLEIVVPGGREALCDSIQNSVMALTQSSGEYDRLFAQYEQWGGSGEGGQLTWGDVGRLSKAKFKREIGLIKREASAWAQSHAEGFLESLEAMLPGTVGDGSGGSGEGGWGPGNDSGGGGYSGSGGNGGEWFNEWRFRVRGLNPQLSCSIFAAEDGSAGLEGTLRTDWGLNEYHAELSGFYETSSSRWNLTVTATDNAQGIAVGVTLL